MICLKEHKFVCNVNVNGKTQECTVYVDEFKTIFSCSLKIKGWQLPSAMDWRYKKRVCKNLNSLIHTFVREFEERERKISKALNITK